MFTVYTPSQETEATAYLLQAELEKRGIPTHLRTSDMPFGSSRIASLCVLREQDIVPAGALIQEIVKDSEPNWRPNS